MHRNPSARLCCTVLLSAVLALTVSDAAPDLYPDPGFEGSGEPGNARTGSAPGTWRWTPQTTGLPSAGNSRSSRSPGIE